MPKCSAKPATRGKPDALGFSHKCGCSCWYCLCTLDGHCGSVKCGHPVLHPEDHYKDHPDPKGAIAERPEGAMSREHLGGCADLAKRLGIAGECCSSCHGDDEQGFVQIGEWECDDGYYGCCCAMRLAAKRAGNLEARP